MWPLVWCQFENFDVSKEFDQSELIFKFALKVFFSYASVTNGIEFMKCFSTKSTL